MFNIIHVVRPLLTQLIASQCKMAQESGPLAFHNKDAFMQLLFSCGNDISTIIKRHLPGLAIMHELGVGNAPWREWTQDSLPLTRSLSRQLRAMCGCCWADGMLYLTG